MICGKLTLAFGYYDGNIVVPKSARFCPIYLHYNHGWIIKIEHYKRRSRTTKEAEKPHDEFTTNISTRVSTLYDKL